MWPWMPTRGAVLLQTNNTRYARPIQASLKHWPCWPSGRILDFDTKFVGSDPGFAQICFLYNFLFHFDSIQIFYL